MSAPRRYAPPPAARPVKRAAPPITYPALERVRAEGRVPQLPPIVYGKMLDALTLTANRPAYLRSRGFDDSAANDYGFRSIDGAREWAALGEGLATEPRWFRSARPVGTSEAKSKPRQHCK
ncbi:hypothetical protein BH11GEM1_BH11GEM1_34180 [soil metagenome]